MQPTSTGRLPGTQLKNIATIVLGVVSTRIPKPGPGIDGTPSTSSRTAGAPQPGPRSSAGTRPGTGAATATCSAPGPGRASSSRTAPATGAASQSKAKLKIVFHSSALPAG